MTLDVGHCFVEPVRVAGRLWVTKRRYGYGGGLPQGFTEEGTFVVLSETRAVFVATGGAEVPFRVAPGPVGGCR